MKNQFRLGFRLGLPLGLVLVLYARPSVATAQGVNGTMQAAQANLDSQRAANHATNLSFHNAHVQQLGRQTHEFASRNNPRRNNGQKNVAPNVNRIQWGRGANPFMAAGPLQPVEVVMAMRQLDQTDLSQLTPTEMRQYRAAYQKLYYAWWNGLPYR